MRLATLTPAPAAAQSVPPLINYQGRLVNSNNIPLAAGDYELRFSIWTWNRRTRRSATTG